MAEKIDTPYKIFLVEPLLFYTKFFVVLEDFSRPFLCSRRHMIRSHEDSERLMSSKQAGQTEAGFLFRYVGNLSGARHFYSKIIYLHLIKLQSGYSKTSMPIHHIVEMSFKCGSFEIFHENEKAILVFRRFITAQNFPLYLIHFI